MKEALRFAIFVTCACVCFGTLADAAYELHVSHAHTEIVCATVPGPAPTQSTARAVPIRCVRRKEAGEPSRLEIVALEGAVFAATALGLKICALGIKADFAEENI